MNLQEILFQKMNEIKFNNRQFAEYLGISQADLSRTLSSKRKSSLNTIKAIYRKYPDLVEVLLK